MRPVICRYCYKKIETKDQLVTAFRWVTIKPFHYLCYQEIQQETDIFWLSWKPLNGWEGNLTSLLLTVLAGWLIWSETGGMAGNIAGVVALYPVALRIFSYYLFERIVGHS